MIEPIPNLTEVRAGKAGYEARYEIDTEHPLHDDPLVDLRDPEFGFYDSRSYYARPIKHTSERLPGIPDAPLVRLDIARRLVLVNKWLRTDPEVREVLGSPARIRIDDAIRPIEAQTFAFEVVGPRVLAERFPKMAQEERDAILPTYIARPTEHNPHATGGAVDGLLVSLETNKGFDRGTKNGEVEGAIFTDFHEGYHLREGESDIEHSPRQAEVAPEGSEIVMSRRVLYYAMTKVGGLYNHPGEIWHYGKGDPLSTYVSGTSRPYYGKAQLPDWYIAEMQAYQDRPSN